MAHRREASRDPRLARRRLLYLRFTLIISLAVIQAPWTESKEAVIFEQFGQLAGVTAYLHVHIELSISSVEQQLSKYRQLLITKLGTEESIRNFMLGQFTPTPRPGVTTPIPEYLGNFTNSAASAIRANSMLWLRIASLHLRDVDDIEHHISSLRNALPPLPGRGEDQIHVKSPFVPPRPNADQHLVHPYPDTHDHMLFAPKDATRKHTSRGLNPYDPHGEEKEKTAKPVPITGSITVTAPSGKTKTQGRKKRNPDPILTSRPLTEEAFDKMVPVRERRGILGAVALPMAVAATAMGLFNRAQIETLRGELFQQKKATRRLFEVVQDFSQNFVGIQNSFHELRSLLFSLVLANPTLLDARLSRIENQLRDRLRRVTHAIQAAVHQRFSVDYLNPAEMRELFKKLEDRAEEAGCELLIQYHSDLFQIETSLLYDGQDGHLLLHVPMTPKNSLLRLFRLHPFPLPLFETHHLLPDVKNDVLAISSTDTRYNVQLSSTDLMSCHRVNQIFMCDSFGVMSSRFNNTCLGSLYMQRFDDAQKLCPFKVVPVEERVYQLRKGHFIVYLPGYTTVNIKCRDGTASEMHLKKGTQQMHIPPGCQGVFPNHLVTSDWSVRLNDSILHFEWDWDPISFMPAGEMEQMNEALKNLGDLRLHQPDLSELQYLTQLNNAHSYSVSGASMSSWAFNIAGAAFIVSFVVIVGCCCFCACKRLCARSTPAPAAASAIIRGPPASPAQARLGAGRPRRSPRLASRILPGFLKRNRTPEPGVSYRVADEEVQLRSAPDPDVDDEEDLPAVYQEATFSRVAPAAVPPPPQYSTLPRAGRVASHGELSRRLSTLSQ
jgi:hypothetical protein